tara:strand:- start:141 stop:986 length:846 start_codon:yes stop_codon:yes gene_type:complete
MSNQNITVVIASFHSSEKILECLNSIDQNIKVIVIENSNDQNLKKKIVSDYKNVEVILSESNLGYGCANNLGLLKVKTNYALIINPDVILKKNAITNFFLTIKKIPNFGIIAPISKNEKYQNFNLKLDNQLKEVENVKGFAMFLNMKSIKEVGFFDTNFFIYFEEIDLCKRLRSKNIKIYIDPSIETNHLGGASHDVRLNTQMELSRNWHWMWSSFYFHKKHYGYISAFLKILPKFFSSVIKFLFYSIMFNTLKKNIYRCRLQGIINSLLLKKSSYRPNIQ